MRLFLGIVGLITGTILVLSTAAAQDLANQPGDPAEDQAIDEITVIAPPSVTRIKSEIVQADRRMFGIFNSMTNDMRYKTYCRLTSFPGTNLKRRVCVPNFEKGVLEEAFDDSSTWTSFNIPQAVLEKHRETYRQMMIDFANENPELKQAIFKRAQLEQDLREARERARSEQAEP